MSTQNRPFFSNFLAAFRAHSAIQSAASSQKTATTQTSYSTSTSNSNTSSTTANNASSAPRQITTKTTGPASGATSVAVHAAGQFQPTRQHATSPYSRSPASPGSPGFPIGGSANRGRRGSDSSSEGFKDAVGAEKWYIGGRTATGEERFYKLSMVKRPRSLDRLSLDRLSL